MYSLRQTLYRLNHRVKISDIILIARRKLGLTFHIHEHIHYKKLTGFMILFIVSRSKFKFYFGTSLMCFCGVSPPLFSGQLNEQKGLMNYL